MKKNNIKQNVIKEGPHHCNFHGEALKNYLLLQEEKMTNDFDKEAKNIVKKVCNGKVLIIGASIVHMPKYLTHYSANIVPYGCDVNEEICKIARKNNNGFSVYHWQNYDLPIPEKYFSYIISFWEFHHWKDPIEAMKLFFRVLKPTGTMEILDLYQGISVKDLIQFNGVTESLAKRMRKHLQYTYSAQSIENIISKSGLSNNAKIEYENNLVRIKIGKTDTK